MTAVWIQTLLRFTVPLIFKKLSLYFQVILMFCKCHPLKSKIQPLPCRKGRNWSSREQQVVWMLCGEMLCWLQPFLCGFCLCSKFRQIIWTHQELTPELQMSTTTWGYGLLLFLSHLIQPSFPEQLCAGKSWLYLWIYSSMNCHKLLQVNQASQKLLCSFFSC